MTALALVDAVARVGLAVVLMLIVAAAVVTLVTGLRDAVDTARDVINHAPVPPPLTSDTCWACGAPVEQEGDTACSDHDLTCKKEKNR